MKNKTKLTIGEKIFDFINTVIMVMVILSTVCPFLYIIAISFSDEWAIISGKVSLFPIGFNVKAFSMVLSNKSFWVCYRNTIFQTVLGVVIGVVMTTICAYPLSKKFLPGRNAIMKMMVLTMYFSGGLIPNYLLIGALGLKDSIWAIVLPGAISVWNMIIVRTFFQGLPGAIEEAAAIDGLNPFGVLFKIVLPLSKPVLATITLFIAVFYWNSWFPQLLYLNTDSKYPVTLFLRNIINGAMMASVDANTNAQDLLSKPTESLKSATILLVAIPILCTYPFVQKYFVQGVMIGSVKE